MMNAPISLASGSLTDMSTFNVIGHRGAAALRPRHAAIYRTPRSASAAWVEFDVQLHPTSGELLLLHDLTLNRTTNAAA